MSDEIEAARPTLRVIGAPALEAHVAALRDQLPEYDVEFVDPAATVSQETQQMEVAAKKDEERLKQEIAQATVNEKKTGPLEVYLLNSQQLASGDTSSQATLRALARATLMSKNNIVAALIPGQGREDEDGMAAAITNIVNHFLDIGKIKVVHSMEALRDCIK